MKAGGKLTVLLSVSAACLGVLANFQGAVDQIVQLTPLGAAVLPIAALSGLTAVGVLAVFWGWPVFAAFCRWIMRKRPRGRLQAMESELERLREQLSSYISSGEDVEGLDLVGQLAEVHVALGDLGIASPAGLDDPDNFDEQEWLAFVVLMLPLVRRGLVEEARALLAKEIHVKLKR